MFTHIPEIAGQQHLPSSGSYEDARCQYATSTYSTDRPMNPGLIVQAESMADVVRTVRYAKEHSVAVASRTGGHAFGGFSSTSQRNIQLDLSKAFKSSADRTIIEGAGADTLVRTSISWSIGEFNSYLGSNNLSVPHGRCNLVHLGGHVQTGGYGQMARSFGLLADHVVALEIVNHNGDIQEVTRDNDPDLFFALLGGSPGNLGILTHVTLKVYRDSDYQGSRALKTVYPYKPETLKKLLDILVEMSDDVNFPRNYDLTINVASSSYPLENIYGGIEQAMKTEHPEWFDEAGKATWPRSISVFAQFVPFAKDDKPNTAWFDRLAGVASPLVSTGVQQMPLSKLARHWITDEQRDYDLPYAKRLFGTDSHALAAKRWAAWMTSRVDAVLAPDDNGLFLACRFQCVGGAASQHAANADNGTALSWRDTSLLALLDCYHGAAPDCKAAAEAWQRGNAEQGIGAQEGSFFCETDRRFLWCPQGDYNLDANWSYYFEDAEKYGRLRAARRAADPHGTFSPNAFCVKRAAGRPGAAPEALEGIKMATGGAGVGRQGGRSEVLLANQ